MPDLTVRDIPADLYRRLRERAGRQRRSMSGEVVTLLEEALLARPVDAGEVIAEARLMHGRVAEPLPDLISAGKRAGRRYESDLGE